MYRGFIKLWRKSLDAEWLRNHVLWAFWCYCLLKATHKSRIAKVGFQEVPLEPGQFIFGIHKAAAELNMSPWKIRASIDFLKKSKNITTQTTNKFSIISIVNWNTYQVEEVELPQAKPQAKLHANRTQTNTGKNEENEKEKMKESRATRLPESFFVTEEMLKWFNDQGFTRISIEHATEEFCDYWRGCGQAKVDWIATWRNGMRNAEKWSTKNAPPKKRFKSNNTAGTSGGRSSAGGGSKYDSVHQTVVDLG